MNVLIAMDSFKGCMTSMEAGESAAKGVRRIFPCAEIEVFPMADGGEGTAEAMAYALNGERRQIEVTGPLGTPVQSEYYIKSEEKLAVMDLSQAAGLCLVPEKKRNPLTTTTFGLGEMIVDAINLGCRKFVIGIGGSATNDGGAGMLQALGVGLLDWQGSQIGYGAEGLSKLYQIDCQHMKQELSECEFIIACDVTNPLCGELGCSFVFSPQKGATKDMVKTMDSLLKNYASMIAKVFPQANEYAKGAGAAGGVGFAFMSCLQAKMISGAKIVIEMMGLKELMKKTDILITGEGKMDAQTAMGKAPIEIAHLGREYNKPVIAFAGVLGKGYKQCAKEGMNAMFPIHADCSRQEDFMDKKCAMEDLADAVEQVFSVIEGV